MDEAVQAKALCRLTFSQIALRINYTKSVLEKEGKMKDRESLYNFFAKINASTKEAPYSKSAIAFMETFGEEILNSEALLYEFRQLEGLCVSYDGPLTGWSKVEKLTGCVKSHLKKRSIVSTLDQRQDYYRFIFRSLMAALSSSDDRSMSKEYVGGGRGKIGLFETYCFRYTVLKELLAFVAKWDAAAADRVRAKLLSPDHAKSKMTWVVGAEKKSVQQLADILQAGEYDATMRGAAKNCASSASDELIVYGSLQDPVGKMKDQLKMDFPPSGAMESLQQLLSEDGQNDGDGPTEDMLQTEAMQLQDRVRKVAKAKVSKMFEVFAPGSSSSSALASQMAAAIACRVSLGVDETGVDGYTVQTFGGGEGDDGATVLDEPLGYSVFVFFDGRSRETGVKIRTMFPSEKTAQGHFPNSKAGQHVLSIAAVVSSA
ncbi:unnamed protein product [Symbiodinium sp. KB8]|nr:unnamed protein product [Symbiodinium sp. KB8]